MIEVGFDTFKKIRINQSFRDELNVKRFLKNKFLYIAVQARRSA